MTQSKRTDSEVRKYLSHQRTLSNLAIIPPVAMGALTLGQAGRLLFGDGDFLSGMLLVLFGLCLLMGAFIVRTTEPSRAFRGIVVGACGAAGVMLLVVLGKAMGKVSPTFMVVSGVAYLSVPAALVWAYCTTAVLRAHEEGQRSLEALARVPGTTFSTVERGITYAVEVGLLVVFVVLVNWAKVQPGQFKRHDWTSLKPGERVFALSSKTKKVLARLEKDVQVIVFMTPPATADQDSIYEDVKELLTRFSARSSHIKVEYIDLHRQLTRAQVLVKKYRLNMSEAVNLESGVGGLVVFVSGDKQKYVNSNDMAEFDYDRGPHGGYVQKVGSFKAEESFLNALLTVTQTTQLRVCFTQGHGEADIEDPKEFGLLYAKELLKREGFIVDKLSKLGDKVPHRCDMVVVAGARVKFSEREESSLRGYLKGGGKLFFAAARVEAVGNSVRFVHTGLEDMLSETGLTVADAFAVDHTLRAMRTPLVWIPEKTWGDHPISKVMSGKRLVLEMPRVVKVTTQKGWKSKVLLETTKSDKAWGERDLGFALNPRSVPKYKAGTDLSAPVAVAGAAREDKRGGARVVVFGTFMNFTNKYFNPNVPMQDFSADFLLNILNWLGQKEQLISLRPRTPERIKLELRADQINRIFRVTVFAMPVMAILLGLLVWWVRKS